MHTIEMAAQVFYWYLLIGIVFASLFLWRGAAQLDESAKGISWKTRALLFPGCTALWPVLWRKWRMAIRQNTSPQSEKTATT